MGHAPPGQTVSICRQCCEHRRHLWLRPYPPDEPPASARCFSSDIHRPCAHRHGFCRRDCADGKGHRRHFGDRDDAVTVLGLCILEAATLSFSGFLSGLAVAWVALGDQFDVGLMLLALALSNIVAVLIGFAGVARAPSMNALMIYLLYGTVILFLPLLVHFSIAPTGAEWILGVIPSYAMLQAFNGAADPASLSMGEWIYAIGYQLVWIAIGWRWAMREFRAYIISSGR